MSRLFYDHLTIFEKIAPRIGMHMSTPIEREEVWHIIDEITHHKVIGSVLEKLSTQYHNEFLAMFTKAPHDNNIILFLEEKIGEDFQELLANDLALLEEEILQIIQTV